MKRDDTFDQVENWLDVTAYPVADADSDRRIIGLARDMARCMRREGRFFSFSDSAESLGIPPEQSQAVRERLYELALRRILREFKVDERDRGGLRWIARRVHLSDEACRQVELTVGRQIFEQHLGFSISAGYLDDEELQQLRSLAAGVGTTAGALFLDYVSRQGCDLLDRILSTLGEEDAIRDEFWTRLLATVRALGAEETAFLTAIRPHARKLVERRLAQTSGDASQASMTLVRCLLERIGGGSPNRAVQPELPATG